MRIAEIYLSIQGEGFLTGTESIFVRTSGCNLRCWFCDTPFTSWSPEGEDLSLLEILDQVEAHDCRHVVLTGGEPMLHAELVPLAAALKGRGLHVTIETAATLDLPVACDLMSISPKLAGSTPSARRHPRWHHRHEETRHAPDVVRRLVRDYCYQVKFVVDNLDDCDEVEEYLAQMPQIDRRRVLLMPQGTDEEQLARQALWLKPYCRQVGLRFCPRRQIEWFGLVRGT
ncbi:MAG: 7-carboxy-7-deazaguanine synthase QueE [Pirellulales bacterium]